MKNVSTGFNDFNLCEEEPFEDERQLESRIPSNPKLLQKLRYLSKLRKTSGSGAKALFKDGEICIFPHTQEEETATPWNDEFHMSTEYMALGLNGMIEFTALKDLLENTDQEQPVQFMVPENIPLEDLRAHLYTKIEKLKADLLRAETVIIASLTALITAETISPVPFPWTVPIASLPLFPVQLGFKKHYEKKIEALNVLQRNLETFSPEQVVVPVLSEIEGHLNENDFPAALQAGDDADMNPNNAKFVPQIHTLAEWLTVYQTEYSGPSEIDKIETMTKNMSTRAREIWKKFKSIFVRKTVEDTQLSVDHVLVG